MASASGLANSNNEAVVKPSLSFSKCGTKRNSSSLQRSKAAKSLKGSHAETAISSRKDLSETFNIAPFRHDLKEDKELERLEKELLANSPQKTKKSCKIAKGRALSRPPIPSFTLYSDDDETECDNLLAPVFGVKVSIDQKPSKAELTRGSEKSNGRSDMDGHAGRQGTCHTSGGDAENADKHHQTPLPALTIEEGKDKRQRSAKRGCSAPVNATAPSRLPTTQPNHESLAMEVDQLYEKCDDEAITVKQFTVTLENRMKITFTAKARSFVRQRLLNLVNGNVSAATIISNRKATNDTAFDLQNIARETSRPDLENPPKYKGHQKPEELVRRGSLDETAKATRGGDIQQDQQKLSNQILSVWTANDTSTEIDEDIPCTRLARKYALKPKEPPRKGSCANADDTAFSSRDNEKGVAAQPSQKVRRRPQKSAANSKIHQPHSDQFASCAEIVEVVNNTKKSASVKTTRKRGKAAACSLCKTCPCTSTTTAEKRLSSSSTNLNFNHSDIAIEKTLIRRLQKLEKTTEKYEEQTEIVRRELKKHRRNILRQQEKSNDSSAQSGQYRFLPDGHELDNQLQCFQSSTKASETNVKQAQKALFGEIIPKHQPTLTQMFGGGSEGPADSGDVGITETIAVIETDVSSDSGEVASNLDDIEIVHFDAEQDIAYDLSDDDSTGDLAFRRVTWKDGERSSEPERASMLARTPWAALISANQRNGNGGTYTCAFNRLFKEISEEHIGNHGIDDLLRLFGEVQSSPQKSPPPNLALSTPTCKPSPVDLSMLTQRGKELAETLERRIASDADKVIDLESACPQWRENIAFALKQNSDEDILGALENVQRSKHSLEKMKETFLKAWQRQQTVLDVFEISLNESRKRLKHSEVGEAVVPTVTN